MVINGIKELGLILGGVVSVGSLAFVYLFSGTYILITICISAYLGLLLMKNRVYRSNWVTKVYGVLSILFSILTIASYFIIVNTVLLFRDMPGIMILYVYTVIFTLYVIYICRRFIKRDRVPEDINASSEEIRYNQLKTLDKLRR
ncbi:hypothetical protein NEOKW01_0656 [Nematocida sp. AWRm80]|nr:hypothetical protein NEOKW01_0656 [Nematocida sp. AWRm80]